MYTAERVIAWNAARYNQEFDYNLAVSLLLEETEELYDAPNVVGMLDAIGDISFVAIGVFWKLGFSNVMIKHFFHEHDVGDMTMQEAYEFGNYIQLQALDSIVEDIPGAMPALALACHTMLISALGALRGLGMQYLFYDVLNAICDSNDTKEVRGKTLASVKANSIKGSDFISPLNALATIEANHVNRIKKRGTVQ